MPIRAVLFDLGDTLIFQAHEPDPERLYALMAEQIDPLLRSWGVGSFDTQALLTELFHAIEAAQPLRRAQGYEVDAAFIARGALASHSVEVSAEQAAAFWRACAVDLRAWGWQLYPDTLDTLRRVRALGLRTALVSNSFYTSDVRRPLLNDLGLSEDLFDAFVLSSDLMRPKPRPEPFERALDAIGVLASVAVFVGDSLDADVRGAKAVGMTTVWKLNGRHEVPPEPEADYAIHDLWELFTLGLLPAETSAALPQQSLMPHEDSNADRY
jgi:HAD superfamily hydrolase (TIGR01509 family)